MNSCRLSSHIQPVRVRNWMPCIHSSCVGSTSRRKACRCVMKLSMTAFSLALGAFAMLLNTFCVICSSVLSLIPGSFVRFINRSKSFIVCYRPGQTRGLPFNVCRGRRGVDVGRGACAALGGELNAPERPQGYALAVALGV